MLGVTRVVLFKHGVGYFQRTGSVESNELIELTFKSSEMNDVLKSLTVLDYGGGRFAALSYDSEVPSERRLAELNLQIPKRGAIGPFLDQLKGARVMVPHAGGTLEGRIVGIEAVEKSGVQGNFSEPHLAVLADGGRLVRVPLLEVPALSFVDEAVCQDLHTLLDILGSSRCKDRKRLSIQAVGEGRRRVSLSYVVEAPVWKTSYRLMLSGEDGGKPLLQGWALVDNTSQDDWQGVKLSLVSGLPISFIHDLYTPRYRERPVVKVDTKAVVGPPAVEKAVAAGPAEVAGTVGGEAFLGDLEAFEDEGAAAPAAALADTARSSVQVQARAEELGDLVTYEITHPVTIACGRSALVPIIQYEPEAERLGLYNPEIRARNPMTAFRLRNSSGLTLEGGPATVFEGEQYVGEAMLATLRPDEECVTPYSIELGVTVEVDREQVNEASTRATRKGAFIQMHYRRLLVTRYHFYSRLDRALTVYLDHRFRHPKREATPEPAEVTEHFWRFRLELAPRSEMVFPVTEVGEQITTIHIPDAASQAIRHIGTSCAISPEAKSELEQIAVLVESIHEGIRELKGKSADVKQIQQGQTRLRDNLKSLGDTADEGALRKRYVTKLGTEEDRLERLGEEIEAVKAKLEDLRTRLDSAIASLRLEPS